MRELRSKFVYCFLVFFLSPFNSSPIIQSANSEVFDNKNFEEVLEIDFTQNIRIYDSDIIKLAKTDKENEFIFKKATFSNIKPKFADVTVLGRVKNPGNKKISRAGSLTDAILISGGKPVLKGPVKFIKYNNDGSIYKRLFRLNSKAKRGTYTNPHLVDGNLIMVGNSFLSNTSDDITELTSPIKGIFTTYALIDAISD